MRHLLRATCVVTGLFLAQPAQADPYFLLYESNTDTNSQELFLQTYNTLTDFLNGNAASTVEPGINVGPAYSIADFTFDSGVYRLLYESDADTNSQELFLQTFNTLTDFVNGDAASTVVPDINVGPAYSTVAFLAQPNVTPVPEPSTLLMLASGLAVTALRRRAR